MKIMSRLVELRFLDQVMVAIPTGEEMAMPEAEKMAG
jgi:hypothetical protein